MSDPTTRTGWTPAPGSVARKNWPLAVRWAWWLAHRPTLVALIGLAVLLAVETGPLVLVALVVVLTTALVVWWRARPESFHATAGGCCWGGGGRSGPTGSGGARR